MPTKKQTVRHVFAGGWATDFGHIAEVEISSNGLVQVPFLTEALNVFYELDGAPHKMGGTSRTNTTAIADAGGTENVTGLFDYWKQGVGGSPSQKLVIHAGTNIEAADLDGDFSTELKTDASDGAIPSYETFDDLLIISSTGDTPISWDQASVVDPLSASAPDFAFSQTHKNRLWAAGVNATPSRLYYSAQLDPTDWAGGGSGFIDIDPNDGDQITGLASHKDNLWVFKGPHKGSIHRISGSAPTGGDSFARINFVRGLGAVWHNTIFRFKDDIGFMWSDGTIHSLNATAAFGDYSESTLSRPIDSWLRDHTTSSSLKKVWAVTDAFRGYTLFTVPVDTATTPNHHLLMDFRFSPPRWSHWNAFNSHALASVVDGGVPKIFDGSDDGFVRRINISARSIDATTGYVGRFDTPNFHYGDAGQMKVIERAALGIVPKGLYDIEFGWTRDSNPEQTFSQGQGGIGFLLDTDFLDTGVLGGSFYADRFMSLEEGGEFRSVSYSARNGSKDQDMEIHSITAKIGVGGDSWEN